MCLVHLVVVNLITPPLLIVRVPCGKKTTSIPSIPSLSQPSNPEIPNPRKLDRETEPRGKVLLLRDRREYRVPSKLVREIEESRLAAPKTDRGHHLSDRESFVHRSKPGPRSREQAGGEGEEGLHRGLRKGTDQEEGGEHGSRGGERHGSGQLSGADLQEGRAGRGYGEAVEERGNLEA